MSKLRAHQYLFFSFSLVFIYFSYSVLCTIQLPTTTLQTASLWQRHNHVYLRCVSVEDCWIGAYYQQYTKITEMLLWIVKFVVLQLLWKLGRLMLKLLESNHLKANARLDLRYTQQHYYQTQHIIRYSYIVSVDMLSAVMRYIMRYSIRYSLYCVNKRTCYAQKTTIDIQRDSAHNHKCIVPNIAL